MPKYTWTSSEILKEITEYFERQAEDKQLICIISDKETKEMIKHTQRKMLRWLCSEISKHMWEQPERVKQIFLIWCFWAKPMSMGKFHTVVPKKPTTSELTKKETIFYIETIWKFICDNKIACKYSPKEIQSLLESYSH